MNLITFYMITKLVNFNRLAEYFVGGEVKSFLQPYGNLAVKSAAFLLGLLLCRFLYNRKVFIRV